MKRHQTSGLMPFLVLSGGIFPETKASDFYQRIVPFLCQNSEKSKIRLLKPDEA
jgi:hypothetical protein